MEKVKLTTAEFLSLYTGVLLLKNFNKFCKAQEKVFGVYPESTMATIAYSNKFREYIDNNNPELAQIVKELGKFKHLDNNDVFKEIEDYCNKFETMTGKKQINVDKMQFAEYEMSFSL